MAQKQLRAAPAVYQATRTFSVGSLIVQVGDTVGAGHPLLKGRAALFRPFQPTFGHIPEPVTEPEAAPQIPVPAPVVPVAAPQIPAPARSPVTVP